MITISDYTLTNQIKTIIENSETFQISQNSNSSKTVNFFEQLYSYPQKLTLKWDTLNEFENDLPPKSRTSSKLSGFDVYNWSANYDTVENGIENTYSFSDYKKGFLNKLNSSAFYTNKTKDIHSALSHIPIFVILNGDNEIILNRVSNPAKPADLKSFFSQAVYDFCGAFDQTSQTSPDLGLFFFNRDDAENYLTNVAKTDIDGTKTVGLSIHCLSLSTAYKVMREYHPDIDFRLVPNLNSAKPIHQITNGVGIYIVDFLDGPKNTLSEPKTPPSLCKAVFFDEQMAVDFYKETIRKSSFSHKYKPRFSTDSFENFLEVWEEQLQTTDETDQNTVFLSGVKNYEQIESTKIQTIRSSFEQKTRILKRFIGIFFSVA